VYSSNKCSLFEISRRIEMRRIVAAVSIVLMGLSTPVLAQSAPNQSAAGVGYSSSTVNYSNGLAALNQAPQNDDDNKGGGFLFGGAGGMGGAGALLLGGLAIGGIAYAISQSNNSSGKPTSP
jgi:hypothetical protein